MGSAEWIYLPSFLYWFGVELQRKPSREPQLSEPCLHTWCKNSHEASWSCCRHGNCRNEPPPLSTAISVCFLLFGSETHWSLSDIWLMMNGSVNTAQCLHLLPHVPHQFTYITTTNQGRKVNSTCQWLVFGTRLHLVVYSTGAPQGAALFPFLGTPQT